MNLTIVTQCNKKFTFKVDTMTAWKGLHCKHLYFHSSDFKYCLQVFDDYMHFYDDNTQYANCFVI